jgi:hypothetical protein
MVSVGQQDRGRWRGGGGHFGIRIVVALIKAVVGFIFLKETKDVNISA